MKILNKLSIRSKILLIAIVGVFGFLIFLANAYIVAKDNSIRLSNVRNIYFPILEKIDANIVHLDKIKEQFHSAVSSGEIEMVTETKNIADGINLNFTHIEEIAPKEKSHINILRNAFSEYYLSAVQLSKGMIENTLSVENMSGSIEAMNENLKKCQTTLKEYRKNSYTIFTSNIDVANQETEKLIINGFVIGVLIITMLIAIAVIVSRIISKNISNVIDSLEELASGDGDLSKQIQTNSNDEIGQLVNVFNKFVANLLNIMLELYGATGILAGSANELATISDINKQAAETQLSETEQVTSAIHEVSLTVAEVARHCQEASSAATEADKTASIGKKQVETTINSIQDLSNQIESAKVTINKLGADSKAIDAVIEVIKGIAEQTNLLALNAAIEAARAGEQGRGFAVVADEVRNLASRTQKSTQEINSMIEKLQTRSKQAISAMEESSQKSSLCFSQISNAGDSLQDITQAVTKINEMNMQIASAAEEQSAVTVEIDKNINNINLIAQESVKNIENNSRASEKLNHASMTIKNIVNKFKL